MGPSAQEERALSTIPQHLGAVRRRGPLIIAAASLAAIVTVGLFLLQPKLYRASADVVVPIPPQTGSLIAAVGQSVSDFEGALRSDVVAQRVSSATGVPSGQVRRRVETERLFGGTVVEVSYTADDPELAEDVAAAASREALILLLEARLAPFEQRREITQANVERISGEYERFLIDAKILDPEDYFRIQNSRMVDLQDDIGRARADGNTERVEELEARFEQKQRQLTPQITRYQLLRGSLDRATAGLAEAESEYSVANASLAAAREGNSIQVSEAIALPRAARLLRQLLVVVVIATALTIGLIVLLELTATPSRPVAAPGVRGEPGREPSEPPLGVEVGRSPAARGAAAQGGPPPWRARRRR